MKAVKKLPKKFQELHNVSLQCMIHLIENGISQEKAEDMVLDILKENSDYLKNGMISFVIANLKVAFLDIPIDEAAKDIMKNIQ